MLLNGWRRWFNAPTSSSVTRARRERVHAGFRPVLETLEERALPAVNFTKNTVPANLAAVKPGDIITYALTVQSTPNADFSVLVADATPTGTTFVSASQDPTDPTQYTITGPAAGGTGQVQWRTPFLPANEIDTLQIVLHVDSNAPAGTLTNMAFYTSAFVPSPGIQADSSVAISPQANVSISKTENTSPVTAGTDITYTVTVSNTGPNDAQNVQVTDAVPSNATFVSETQLSGPAFTLSNPPAGGSGTTVDTISVFQSGATATFQIVDHVLPNNPNGSVVVNTASVTTSTTNTSQNTSSTVTTPITTLAGVSVTKTGPAIVTAGTQITYAIKVSNSGPSDAFGVTLSDVLPGDTTFASISAVAGWSASTPAAGQGGTVTETNPDFAFNATVTFTLIVNVPASEPAASLTNTATVTTGNANNPPGPGTSSVTTTVQTAADLSVVKTGPATVTAGQDLTYTITLRNLGPSDAQGVILEDTVPSDTTFVSFTESGTTPFGVGAPPVGGSGTIVATAATLPANEIDTFILVVHVLPSTPAGFVIANTVFVFSNTTDPTPNDNNDISTATTNVATAADLAVTKTGPAIVTAGTQMTYTISLNNAGPSDAQNVLVSDTLPANTTFVSATAPVSFVTSSPAVGSGGTVDFNAAAVAAGENDVFTITVLVAASVPDGTAISNTATASSSTTDPTPGNNSSTFANRAVAVADVGVTKTGPAVVTAGTNVTYDITVTNNGPSDAQNVSLTDATPANTTFVSDAQTSGTAFTISNPAVGQSGTITANTATLVAGDSATFQIVVHVAASAPQNTTISNTATTSSSTTQTGTDHSATVNSTVATSADLRVNKTGPASATAGTNITYTITLTNNGPSDAQNVSLNDVLPPNTTFVSETHPAGFTSTTPAVGAAGTVSEQTPTFVTGASGTFTIVVRLSSSAPQNSVVSNTATVTSTTPNPFPADATSTTITLAATVADLAITKTAPASVVAGNNLTYTITLTNNGPSDAQNVALTDVIPTNTTFVSESQSGPTVFTLGTPAPGGTGTITDTAASMAAGATDVFTVVVLVSPSAPNGSAINNTASAGSTTADSNPLNNASTTSTSVSAVADLSITKTGPATVTAGTNLTYTLSVTNAGPSNAQGVLVSDTTPAGTTFVSATQTGGPAFQSTAPAAGSSGTVAFLDSTPFAPGAAATFTIVVKASSSDLNNSTISNTANVSSSTTDNNAGNNSSTVNTTVSAVADLAVTKTGPATVTAGTNLTYTITLTNNGPSDAQTVSLTDTTPAGTTFVSETHPAGFTSTTPAAGGTGTITESSASLASGASATFTIVVNANSSLGSGTTISNTATGQSATADSNPANNTSTVVTTSVTTFADLAVSKTGPAVATAGTNLTYTITLTNNGPSDAQNVSLTDTVPAGATFVSVTPAAGFTATTPAPGSGGTITETATSFAASSTVTFTLVVQAAASDANGSSVSNTASVTSASDPNPANNSSTVTTTIVTSADLAVTKTGPAAVTAGSNVTYTITVTNNGPSNAQNVLLTDLLPAGTTFVSETHPSGFASTTPGAGGTGTVTESGAVLTANGTATFTIIVKANSNLANASTFNNTATVSSGTNDPNPANNTATSINAAVSTSADLAVTKSGPATVTAGTNVTYTITLTNNGPSDAAAVSLTDAVPAGTTFVSETHPSGFVSTTPAVGGTGTITETGATLAAGASATFTVVVKATASDASGSTVTNTANATSATPDPTAADNSSTVTSTVATSADVSITKTGTAGPVDVFTPVTYTVTVTNNGPSDALAVVLTDTVPSGATITSMSFPQGSRGTGAAANTFNLGTVAAGATVSGTVVVTFTNTGSQTDTAAVSSTTADANPVNNSSSATTTIAQPQFAVTGVPVNGFELSQLTNVPVATFTFGNNTHPASDFTAVINWGDNATSAGTITLSNGTYTVSGTHTYADEAHFPISVSLSGDNASATVNTTATVLEELLPDGTRGTSDQRFVSEIYRDMLGRKVDPGGLANWSGELAAGMSRFQVVLNIQYSSTNEFLTDEVETVYQQYLNRAADPQGLGDSINFLRAGGTVEQLIANVAASPEFNTHTNGTNDGWLDVFYQDALHRAVGADRAQRDAQFTQGQSRTQVANSILATDEYLMNLIQSDYLHYLDRQPEPAGATAWLNAEHRGLTDEQLINGMMTSTDEFYNKTVA